MVKEGRDITVFVTGSIIVEKMYAATELEGVGISIEVVSAHTLKPIDKKEIIRLLSKTKKFATVEEHNVIGGLYGVIAEALADENVMLPSVKIGLDDVFATDYGTLQNVRYANGIRSDQIALKIREFLDGSI